MPRAARGLGRRVPCAVDYRRHVDHHARAPAAAPFPKAHNVRTHPVGVLAPGVRLRLYPSNHDDWLRLLLDRGRTAAAERVYEDDFVVAIMDIHPATAGHVLVIPRNHSQDLWHIGREDAEKAMAAAVRIAGMIRRALGPGGINLVHATGHAAWQSVFHFHLHLVPRYEDDGLVPPWPLDQPRGEEASLRAVADKLRSVSAGASATQASSQAGPAG